MKIKHVITTLALAGLMGAGAFAGIKSSGAAKEAKAATTGYSDVYLDLNQTNWYWKENRVVYAYYYGSSTSSTTWTGNAMTEGDCHIFHAEVPSDATKIVFNVNGWSGDCQTEDLSFDSTKTMWTITTKYEDGTNQKASCEAYVAPRTVYVLDKTGDLLTNGNARIHAWRNDSYVVKTDWTDESHGLAMTNVSGNIYSATIPGVMTGILFNNNGESKTADLSLDGECSVLENDWDGSKWTSLLAAQFVDTYMKFDSIPTSDVSQGTDCKNGWDELYTAYTTTYASVQSDIIAIKDVADRLSAWAEANGKTINKQTGAVSSNNYISSLIRKDSNDYMWIVIVASSIAMVTLLGAGLMIKRRKEDR